jgi:hypothetical protein
MSICRRRPHPSPRPAALPSRDPDAASRPGRRPRTDRPQADDLAAQKVPSPHGVQAGPHNALRYDGRGRLGRPRERLQQQQFLSPSGDVTASVAVGPTPAGDATRGATLYGATGANRAECHGATGHGSPEGPDATSFTIMGASYDFPAPGLNAEDGSVAGDPEWTPALLAVSAYSAMDNGGLTLRLPMPGWLAEPNSATGKPLRPRTSPTSTRS